MTFHEGAVLILFIVCVMLWFFRDPGFVPGWAHFIEDAHVDDATAVMIIVLFLFSIPAKPSFWCLRPLGGIFMIYYIYAFLALYYNQLDLYEPYLCHALL